jgi:diadenosine tetraphosphate (Ap4A) HIT family hydrolase
VDRGGCLVCQEIDGEVEVPDGLLVDTDTVGAFHRPPWPDPEDDVFLGHLLVCPHRHAPDWAALTDDEAADVGAWVARLSRALKGLGATRVYTMTLGHAVDHLHVHLVPRWPETPQDVTWQHVDDYPGARRGPLADAAELAARLRDEL